MRPMPLITPDLPVRLDGWLIVGEGRDLVVTAADDWPTPPVLHLGALALAPTRTDGDMVVWSLTIAQVADLIDTHPRGLDYRVTVGAGDDLRSRVAGYLQVAPPGQAADGVRVGPTTIIVGPPGVGATPEQIAMLVADYLDAHPPTGVTPADVTAAIDEHADSLTPHPAYDEIPDLALIFDNHLI